MKQLLHHTTLLLLPVALAGTLGLRGAWLQHDDGARAGAAPHDAQAVYRSCRDRHPGTAPTHADTGPRTQAPQWVQQQHADIEQCMRRELQGPGL